MKKILLLGALLSIFFVNSQEFKTYDNGLIYSPLAMKKLSAIVGDKNSEFRKCELTEEYKSIEQAKGIFFTLKPLDRKTMKKELLENIGFKEFFDKYGTKKNLYWKLITKNEYSDYDDDYKIRISEEPEGKALHIRAKDWEKSNSKNWVFDFSDKDEVTIVYLQEGFKRTGIPEKYARMVQYSECMIDTTTQVFTKEAQRTGILYESQESTKKQDKLIKYVNDNYPHKRPEYPTGDNITKEEYYKAYERINAWEISKRHYVKTHLAMNEGFCELLNEAYNEAAENKSSFDEFEDYVAMLMSSEKALQLKRNRIVVGSCSMDDSPRIHAMNIAQLSAESFSWDVFLRSHLNILNDRVNRVSDGSYAWAARDTYIKELEELNIEVLDLMLGISLRIDDPVKGHYYGSIGRIGRAIAESKDVDVFKGELLLAIADDQLDDYNRLLMYYLYENLEYHKDRSEEKVEYKDKSEDAVQLLPVHVRPENS